MTICRISGHFFHENFTDFDQVFGVSDENGTYYDWELYVLDPKLTLTCNVLRRKVPILYRIGKKYSASSVSRGKKYLALTGLNISPFNQSELLLKQVIAIITCLVIFQIRISSGHVD